MKVPFLSVAAVNEECRPELDEAYCRVVDSGWYILGQELESFEKEFATYCGARYCVGVGNGLDALHLILRGLGIGPGDEVIVPAYTFIATWLAVTHAGAVPVPVEPCEDTLNIDPERIERAITPKTRAIIAVHLFGRPARVDLINAVAKQHGLKLIEDAAQAHGARLDSRPAGSLGHAAAFSFYPAKNLGALGDGGAIVTNDQDLVNRVQALRNYGGRLKYQHTIPGFNSRLDPLQAAFLRVKLRRLRKWNEHRRKVAAIYRSRLSGVPGLVIPPDDLNQDNVWHLYVIRHGRRNELQNKLKQTEVETSIHYPVPPHLSCAYASGPWREGNFPLTEQASKTALSLPMGPHVDATSAQFVADVIAEFASRATDARHV